MCKKESALENQSPPIKRSKGQWTRQKPKSNRAKATKNHPAVAATATATNSRERALLAVMDKESFLSDHFGDKRDPFAEELAFGAMRWKIALEKQIRASAKTGKMKRVTRWIIVLGLYERHFINKSPEYAKVNEWVALVKKYAPYQVGLVNALLRTPDLKRPEHREAYPEELHAQSHDVLEILNTYPSPQARRIGSGEFITDFDVSTLSQDPSYYIQNPTPYNLMCHLAQHTQTPKRILDLCAAPGGKTLILRDLYPEAHIDCFDISPLRLKRLMKNLEKYSVEAGIYTPECAPYDLVVVDAPCSGSGVMHKKPEARHRFDGIPELIKTQHELIAQAKTLGKTVWYLTCSILDRENHSGAHARLQLPTREGLDGGYAAIMG